MHVMVRLLPFELQPSRVASQEEEREVVLLRFTRRVFELQHSMGNIAVVENPQGSDLWRHRDMVDLMSLPGVRQIHLDMCRYGMTSIVDGRPLRKPMTLLTNDANFAELMGKKCDRGHGHRVIQGHDTKHSGAYTTAFGTAVVHACERAWEKGETNLGETYANFPTEQVEYVDEETYGANSIFFKGKVKPVVASTLKRVHQQLGHPPNQELIRRLRIGGASPAIIRFPGSLNLAWHWTVVAADIIWVDTMTSSLQQLPDAERGGSGFDVPGRHPIAGNQVRGSSFGIRAGLDELGRNTKAHVG